MYHLLEIVLLEVHGYVLYSGKMADDLGLP